MFGKKRTQVENVISSKEIIMILFDLQNTRNNLREEGGRLRRPSTTVDYILLRTSNLGTYMIR